jgi:hypothetical protein
MGEVYCLDLGHIDFILPLFEIGIPIYIYIYI